MHYQSNYGKIDIKVNVSSCLTEDSLFPITKAAGKNYAF